MREARRDGPRIRVDANGAWEPDEAIERLGAMARHGLELAEQPAPDLEGLARVRRGVRVPIAADESVTGADDARRAVELGACDLATVKLAKVGGIAAALGVAHEIPIYLSSALDGPVGIAAAAHTAQAPAREAAPGSPTGSPPSGCSRRRSPPRVRARRPELSVPDEPGLGVEIDDLALARHKL